tara:strand:- start:2047 stop:2394 length:348 start_codon:yes stop_codon:yes gene_type:complete
MYTKAQIERVCRPHVDDYDPWNGSFDEMLKLAAVGLFIQHQQASIQSYLETVGSDEADTIRHALRDSLTGVGLQWRKYRCKTCRNKLEELPHEMWKCHCGTFTGMDLYFRAEDRQ